ncbi:1,3-beta-glucanosyltransferase GAS4 [Candida viswanathii]|uniref:1,3-beta-glucanosyltransferase n=1 Tax=Candida viswanathii TaxID=5486 RepID=A0A367Y0H5_9ASCO|nr:1,3-beta-glucanosyltransferase GAS4 [Candida viswanathii]
MSNILLIFTLVFFRLIAASIHPIIIHGHYFIDSVTKEPFYIKGIDYQPGGSSAVSEHTDPLSDPVRCARDIVLFQELGINTVRIYSVNAHLNHDACMTMLARAGIYLFLDVNSPLPHHHLNRYEPWNTYTLYYVENVFRIVEQFAHYNNTLGFIAGNEIVNDPISASVAAPYVKAVVRDIKTYIEYNAPRVIPVGYSAADDLNYRMPLAQYLECADENTKESVDFYGINSYQWCGDQTFYSSGYNILVSDYKGFSKPIFFSEYGCNEVLPRNFDEVPVLYTNDMIDVFSGGLVYEYSQEPNNYGLVEIQPNGDVKILRDFVQLKKKFDTLPELDYNYIVQSMKENAKEIQTKLKNFKTSIPNCELLYPNLDISKGVPPTIAQTLIETGIEVQRGKYVPLTPEEMTSNAKYFQENGEVLNIVNTIDEVVDLELEAAMVKSQKSESITTSTSSMVSPVVHLPPTPSSSHSSTSSLSSSSSSSQPAVPVPAPMPLPAQVPAPAPAPIPEHHPKKEEVPPPNNGNSLMSPIEDQNNAFLEMFHKVIDPVRNFCANLFN